MSFLDDLYHKIYYYRKFDYHTSFGVIVALEFFIRASMCLILCLVIRKINEFALDSTVSRQEPVAKAEQLEQISLSTYKIPYYILQACFFLIKKLIKVVHWVVSFLVTFYLSLAPAVLHGFHVISFPTCMVLTISIYFVYFFSFVLRDVPLRKIKSEASLGKGIRRRWSEVIKIAFLRYPVFYVALALFCLLLAVSIPVLLDELCVCFFCDYGVPFASEHSRISSRIMRKYTIPDPCPPGPPCHVYTTLPEDGGKSVFINAHTSVENDNIKIYYDTLKNFQETGRLHYQNVPTSYKFNVEAKGRRYVHSAYVRDLTEDTEYYFEIHYNNMNQYSNIFRTLPSKEMERNIVIISGGDVSANDRAQRMTENFIPLKPDAIFIDGDAAYDDGMSSCYYSNDMFINMFENLNRKLGYMVPLIISAGNHDLGVNSLNEAKIPRDERGPPFFMFFPQHSAIGDSLHTIPAVPDIHQRKTYFYHLIGNTLHVSLDSGYDVPFGGIQARWLDKVSYSYSDYVKFAHQHVPIYPACEDEDDMPAKESEIAAQVWTPIFENHNFKGVFENHVHLLKKTYPLRKGVPHADGVIYFGDGNWGVTPHGCSEKNTPVNRHLFERIGNESHVWVMNVTKTGWEYYPLGLDGKKIMNSNTKNFRKRFIF